MCPRPRDRAYSFDLDSDCDSSFGMDAAVSNPFDVDPLQEDSEDELIYERTPENVCLDHTVKTQMDEAAGLMVAFAFSSRVPQQVRQLASIASELMGELGPLQEHGLTCVHQSCVCDFNRMHMELRSMFPDQQPTPQHSLGHILKAVQIVMILGHRFLPEELQRSYVAGAITSLESMMGEDAMKFDFGSDDHVCVPLYTRGNLDPDGTPNYYT